RLSAYQKRRLRGILDDHDARIVAVSPGLFKIPLASAEPATASMSWMERAFFEAWEQAREVVRFHLEELLPASLDYATELAAWFVYSLVAPLVGRPPWPVP